MYGGRTFVLLLIINQIKKSEKMSKSKSQKIEAVKKPVVENKIVEDQKIENMEDKKVENIEESKVDNVPQDEAPKDEAPIEEAPKEPTIEELQAIADEAAEKSYKARSDKNLSEKDKAALRLASYKADAEVDKAINKIKVEEANKLIETKRETYFQEHIYDLVNLFDNDSLNEDAKGLLNSKVENLKKLLEPSFQQMLRKQEIQIPMGATGKSLAKKAEAGGEAPKEGRGKSGQIKELLNAGKNLDEIVEATGFSRKLVTDIRWAWEIETGRREKKS